MIDGVPRDELLLGATLEYLVRLGLFGTINIVFVGSRYDLRSPFGSLSPLSAPGTSSFFDIFFIVLIVVVVFVIVVILLHHLLELLELARLANHSVFDILLSSLLQRIDSVDHVVRGVSNQGKLNHIFTVFHGVTTSPRISNQSALTRSQHKLRLQLYRLAKRK